jgi:hypothetical protein
MRVNGKIIRIALAIVLLLLQGAAFGVLQKNGSP